MNTIATIEQPTTSTPAAPAAPAAPPTRVTLLPPSLREAFGRHGLVPLWESVASRTFGRQLEVAELWAWDAVIPTMRALSEVRAEHILERRVLSFVNPAHTHEGDEATTATLNATMQMVLPGERAGGHRHPMNALRMVLESSGGTRSIVDGKDCPMEFGDLILTPGYCWHEHINDGDEPIVWMDVLDVALHHFLRTTGFQPGPPQDVRPQLPDSAFAVGGFVPMLDGTDHRARPYSPVFRYPWGDTIRALDATPAGIDGSREVRYCNPLTGGPSMDLLDSTALQLGRGQTTRTRRTSASSVFCVLEGHGSSRIGDKVIDWSPRDIFTAPSHLNASHTADSDVARLFQVSNREVFRRLGLFSETFED